MERNTAVTTETIARLAVTAIKWVEWEDAAVEVCASTPLITSDYLCSTSVKGTIRKSEVYYSRKKAVVLCQWIVTFCLRVQGSQ